MGKIESQPQNNASSGRSLFENNLTFVPEEAPALNYKAEETGLFVKSMLMKENEQEMMIVEQLVKITAIKRNTNNHVLY